MDLLKKKTTWIGVLIIGKGLVTGIFEGDWATGVNEILAGLALIAGRDAIRRFER